MSSIYTETLSAMTVGESIEVGDDIAKYRNNASGLRTRGKGQWSFSGNTITRTAGEGEIAPRERSSSGGGGKKSTPRLKELNTLKRLLDKNGYDSTQVDAAIAAESQNAEKLKDLRILAALLDKHGYDSTQVDAEIKAIVGEPEAEAEESAE